MNESWAAERLIRSVQVAVTLMITSCKLISFAISAVNPNKDKPWHCYTGSLLSENSLLPIEIAEWRVSSS